jgi:hypothetical protein
MVIGDSNIFEGGCVAANDESSNGLMASFGPDLIRTHTVAAVSVGQGSHISVRRCSKAPPFYFSCRR